MIPMNPWEYRLQQLEAGLTNHWHTLQHLAQRINMLENAVKSQVSMGLTMNKSNNVLSPSQMELLAHRISTMEMTIQQLLKNKQAAAAAKAPGSFLNKDYDLLLSSKNNNSSHHRNHPMSNSQFSVPINVGDGPKIPSNGKVTDSQTTLCPDVIGQDKNGVPTWMNIMIQQQQQKSNGPPSSIPDELKKSTSNLRDETLKKVRDLCNKLNVSNFTKLSKEFETLYVTRQDNYEEERRIHCEIMSFIFERAVAEVDNLSSPTCYAHLMAQVRTYDTANLLLYQNMLNQLSKLSSSHFSQLFEDDDDNVSPITHSASATTSTTDINNLDKDLAQLETTRRRHQGILRFIGELFKVDIISINDMKTFMDCLLVHPKESGIDHLCYLLKIIGEKLETAVMDNPWFKGILLELAMKKDFMTNKTKFAIMDILELRAKGWKVESGHQQGTTNTLKEPSNEADNVPFWRAVAKSSTATGPVPLLSLDLTIPLASASLRATPPLSSAGGSNSQGIVEEYWYAGDNKLSHSQTLTFKLFGRSIHQILDLLSRIPSKEQRRWVRDNIKCSLTAKNHTEFGNMIVTEIYREAVQWPDKAKVGMAGSFLGFLHRGNCVSRVVTIDALKTVISSELIRFAPDWHKADSILTNIGIFLTQCFIKGSSLGWLMTIITPEEDVTEDEQMMFNLIFKHVTSQIQSIRGTESYIRLIDMTKQKNQFPVGLSLVTL